MTAGDELTKIFIDLPNHSATGGESMWARRLDGDLYELHNSPFYAYGLNFLDVVRAVANHPEERPTVLSVERRSGRRTLRVKFPSGQTQETWTERLQELDHLGVTWEGTGDGLFALDVKEESYYQAVCDRLWEWEGNGILQYETCEARIPDGFDAAPDVG
jgi:hypothetical protein